MDNDKELLELAAKAAGYAWNKNVADYRNEKGILGLWILEPMMTGWNPLEDDGDALRLAVKLELDIMCASVRSVDEVVDVTIQAGADIYAATRRAIVRAAAEIGRNMK